MFQELIFGTANGARVGTEVHLPNEDVDLDDLDAKRGFVDYPRPDGGWKRVDYSSVLDARLAFGLWREVGPYTEPVADDGVPGKVPKKVAAAGTGPLVAYLLCNQTERCSEREVADLLDVERRTVKNHTYRVRISWDELLELPERVIHTRGGTPMYYFSGFDYADR